MSTKLEKLNTFLDYFLPATWIALTALWALDGDAWFAAVTGFVAGAMVVSLFTDKMLNREYKKLRHD